MEAKVASAEKRAAEAEAKLTSLLPPPSTPSLPLSSPPATPLPSSTAPTADQPVKVKTQPSPSPSPSLTALGDSPGGYLRQALQEVTAEVATLRANMVTRSTSAGGGAGLGAGLGAEGEERVLLEKLMEDLHATEAALKEMKLQLDEAREEVLVLKGEGSVNSNTNSNSNPQPPPSPSQTQTLIDVSASIPRFFAQIRASHGGLKKLAERIDEMEELAEMAASLVSLPPTAALRDKTEEGGGWQQKYEDLKVGKGSGHLLG